MATCGGDLRTDADVADEVLTQVDSDAESSAPSGRTAKKSVSTKSTKVRTTKTRAALTSRRCLTILARLDALGVVSTGEARTLATQAKRAAKSRRKCEQEKAGSLLGRVLARSVAMREAEVREAQSALDDANCICEEHESELAKAESSIKDAQKAVADGKGELKDAEKAIKLETKAILNIKEEKKVVADCIKVTEVKKRQLQDVEECVYAPLKEARVEGSERQKQVRVLCKAGEKHGLHKELLCVAPMILRKQLDKRQTFDRTVINSLDAEFTKHIDALSSEIHDRENSLQEHDSALQAKQEALLRARAQKKASARKIDQAVANIGLFLKVSLVVVRAVLTWSCMDFPQEATLSKRQHSNCFQPAHTSPDAAVCMNGF